MSARVPVTYLKAGEVFTYRLAGSPAAHSGTVKSSSRGANGGTVIILTDGTRLTFDAGQHVIRTGVAS